MNLQNITGGFLRAVGVLLVILGLVHLAATPHIPLLLKGISMDVYERVVGPTLLNHVLVGILLLPLGYTTYLASAARNRSQAWARRILGVNAVVLLTLPLSIVLFMHRREYYTAPLFITGVAIVGIISLLMVVAVYALVRERHPVRQ